MQLERTLIQTLTAEQLWVKKPFAMIEAPGKPSLVDQRPHSMTAARTQVQRSPDDTLRPSGDTWIAASTEISHHGAANLQFQHSSTSEYDPLMSLERLLHSSYTKHTSNRRSLDLSDLVELLQATIEQLHDCLYRRIALPISLHSSSTGNDCTASALP